MMRIIIKIITTMIVTIIAITAKYYEGVPKSDAGPSEAFMGRIESF